MNIDVDPCCASCGGFTTASSLLVRGTCCANNAETALNFRASEIVPTVVCALSLLTMNRFEFFNLKHASSLKIESNE